MKASVRIFNSRFELAESMALDIVSLARNREAEGRPFAMAIPGGSSPRILFTVLGEHFGGSVNWNNVHIFWIDERCVPPSDAASNYGMAKASLLDRIEIPGQNVHRIKGEADPEKESIRYSAVLRENTDIRNGIPGLDLTLLGMGEDGHVASIFPGNEALFDSDKPCHVARHPQTGQKRITLSGKIINNSGKIYFMVTGNDKAEIVRRVLCTDSKQQPVPASFVCPAGGAAVWYLDREAASLIPSGTADGLLL